MNVSIVVCTDACGGIGYKQQMPWHNQEELSHFKQLTYGHTVVYGRKTYESIGGILEGRRNLIVSRSNLEGVEVIHDFEAFLKAEHQEDLYICGGGEIYRQAMPYTDYIYRSILKERYRCDTFFEIPSDFVCIKTKDFNSFTLEIYRRTKYE